MLQVGKRLDIAIYDNPGLLYNLKFPKMYNHRKRWKLPTLTTQLFFNVYVSAPEEPPRISA